MKITNEHNLPEAFVEMAKQDYEYKEGQYSVTSLLRGLRETILLRRYHDDIEQDVSDMIWLLFGTAIHTILENQETGEHEKKEKYTIAGSSADSSNAGAAGRCTDGVRGR